MHNDNVMKFCLWSAKYMLFGLALSLVFSMKAFGAEPVQVEGVIKADTTWSGRVLVAGDVLVPEGVTLTVAPGTEVMFVSSESSKIEPAFLSMQTELVVRGRLAAEGTGEKLIVFRAAPEAMNTTAPVRGAWGGILFDGAGASGSSIKFAVIEQADTALAFYGGASPTVEKVTVQDCKYGAVSTDGSVPYFRKTLITGCEFGVVSGPGSSPRMIKCAVEKNEVDWLRE